MPCAPFQGGDQHGIGSRDETRTAQFASIDASNDDVNDNDEDNDDGQSCLNAIDESPLADWKTTASVFVQ